MTLGRVTRVIACSLGILLPLYGLAMQKGGYRKAEPTETLRRYIEMRLHNAKWEVYSKLVTWPDEPSWDCKWATDGYEVGHARVMGMKSEIPVTYQRVGLFCDNLEFTTEKRPVVIKYDLQKEVAGWKVSGPTPDYPEIDVQEVLKGLNVRSTDPGRSVEDREQAKAVLERIKEVLSTK